MITWMAHKNKILAGCLFLIMVLAGYFFRTWLWEMTENLYNILSDKEAIRSYITSWGIAAPLVFMAIQILQVIFAPIPGEATGFVGGFVFGTFAGFVYSTIGLSLGSVINFWIGRLLGNKFIRRIIPQKQMNQMHNLVRGQGAIVLFILFLFPGFPKDYLCLFLGVSDIPFKLFLIMATIGRMPGTMALSVQGASLYEQQYVLMSIIMALCVLCAYLSYRYKEQLYRWMEKLNGN